MVNQIFRILKQNFAEVHIRIENIIYTNISDCTVLCQITFDLLSLMLYQIKPTAFDFLHTDQSRRAERGKGGKIREIGKEGGYREKETGTENQFVSTDQHLLIISNCVFFHTIKSINNLSKFRNGSHNISHAIVEEYA